MRFCRPLDQLSSADAAAFGGKSTGLGELLAAGIPVPGGFAISTAAFAADGELGAAARDEVLDSYAALGGGSPAVAVRSSAVGEDSLEATFAGQLESYLWVRGAEAVCDAVRECRASLHGVLADSYREHLGPAGAEPTMGVTVQLMVDAKVAGVMFTCNPVSGDRSMVAINASWGLGLAVVAGEVTPDDYLISKVTREIVRERIGHKPIEFTAGAQRTDVPPERRDVPCLDRDQVDTLLGLARKIERHFGTHQDIEWALGHQGHVYVVQSRPVTALGGAAAKPVPTPEPSCAIALVMRQFGA
jgi:pyruvate, water dikinase